MSWTLLLLLACPLMMVFCMKGMFSGKKEEKSANLSTQPTESQSIEALQAKMAELAKQNEGLLNEVKAMKEEKRDNETTKGLSLVKNGNEKKVEIS